MSLHRTTELIKKILKAALIGGGTFIILIFIFRIGMFVKGVIFPAKPIPPDVKFGKLPSIPFGEPVLKENFNYSLETLTGKLPELPDKVKVYKIVFNPTTLLNSKETDSKAVAIDFKDSHGDAIPHKAIQSEQYEWTDDTNTLPRILTMNINNYNFTLQSPYIDHEPILNSTYIANQEGAKEVVVQLLTNMGLYYKDIDPEKSTTELLSIKNGTLVPAKTLSATQVVRVNLFQKDIEEIPIYYPRYPHSTMDFLVASRSLDFTDIVDGHFTHQQIKLPDADNPDPEDTATYPAKTVDEAYQELQDGKAFISNYFGSKKDISITDVSLGYFLSELKQEYIMPIYVFHASDGEFYGFVSAIKEDWITN
jgi:hypothetical protein